MKMTKKILSLVLAAALIFGTVAVAANAATLLTTYEGSEATYTLVADKTSAMPGETVTVEVYFRSNYYLGPNGCEFILWDKGVFAEVNSGTTVTYSDFALHWKENYAPAKATMLHDTYSFDDYSGVLLKRFYNGANAGIVQTAEEDTLLYTIEFLVAEDAKLDTTAKIFFPEDQIMSASSPAAAAKQLTYQGVNNSDSDYSSGTLAKKYAETVTANSLEIYIGEKVVDEPTTEEPTTQEPTTEDPGYTGDLLTTFEGSEAVYTIVADKKYAKPGETVTVEVYFKSNYYLGPNGCEFILWDKGVFAEVNSGTTVTYSDFALHWKENYAPAKATMLHDTYSFDDYSGVLLKRFYNGANAGIVQTARKNTLLYTIEFLVAEDAQDGATAKIFFPEDQIMSASSPAAAAKQLTYQGVNNSDSDYSSGTLAKKYAETVTANSVTITIGEEPAGDEPTTDEPTTQEPVVEYADLTALKTALDKAATTSTANCTSATVAEFEAAKTAAQTLYDSKPLASEQEKVTAAANRLEAAITGLTPLGTVNYDALVVAMNEYKTAEADKANYSNWAEYEALYNKAAEIDQNVVYDDEKGTIQAAVNAAAKALNDFVLVEYTKVDYKALNDAITAYGEKVDDKDIYSNWAEYEALYNEAKAIDQSVVYDKNGEQAAADAAAKALNDFVLTEYAKVNYDALNDAIAAYEDKLDEANLYANWADYEALYEAAKEIDQSVVYNKNGEQAKVDAAAEALANFQLEDKTLSYDKWDAAVNAIPADLAGFKPASVTAYEAAKAQAEADKDAAVAALDQTALDAAADALTAAIAMLEVKADNSALVAAVARAEGLVESNYTPDSWASVNIALFIEEAKAVLANGDATESDIATAVKSLEDAEAALVIKADKEALELAILTANAKIVIKDTFTPASYNDSNIEAVKEAALVVFRDENATAQQVADAIAALAAAEAKLVEKADKAALEAAINKEVVLENATAESLAEYNAKLQAAQAVLADDNASEEEVLAATNNLLAAIDDLDYYGACDYTAYNDAVKAANELVADEYTTSSWAAADIEAVLAANAVEDGLMDKDGNQDKINAAATAINAAIALLEKKADVSALADAVAKDPKVPEQYATVETWTAYAQAKAEAEDILANAADTGVSAQGAVDAATKALNDANDGLVEAAASYKAVEDALAYVETKGELNQYTQASVKALQKAIDAVVYGLGVSRQDDINAWAQDIIDAANALEVSKAAITNLEVNLDDYTVPTAKEYAFTVTGAPTKIQIIRSCGNTTTVDRYHRNVKIVSYNEAGEVVNYVDEAPAYEIWTITLVMGEGVHQARAKYGKVWEAFTYEFEVNVIDPAENEVVFVGKVAGSDAEYAKSVTIAAGAIAEFKIVTHSTVNKVQLTFPGGTTTYTAAKATVVDNGDGTKTWTVTRKIQGSMDIGLKLKDASGWYVAETAPCAVAIAE